MNVLAPRMVPLRKKIDGLMSRKNKKQRSAPKSEQAYIILTIFNPNEKLY